MENLRLLVDVLAWMILLAPVTIFLVLLVGWRWRSARSVGMLAVALITSLALQTRVQAEDGMTSGSQTTTDGTPGLAKLNSREFQEALEDGAFLTNDPERPLVVRDEDQTLTGYLEEKDGTPKRFEYSYPEYYDIATVLNEANIPFTTIPQNGQFWDALLFTLFLILPLIWMIWYSIRSKQESLKNDSNDRLMSLARAGLVG